MGRRSRRAVSALGTLVVLAMLAAAIVAVAQPRFVVGAPLPQVASARFLEKPDPPKRWRLLAAAKAGAVDLVDVPAPVELAAPGDPVAQQVTAAMVDAIARAGDAGQSGVYVMDADGRVVFDSGGTVPLIPASTAKLVTAAAALTAFGPDHTFATTVSSDAPVGPEGVLAGDLVVTGGGDPTLVSQDWIEGEVDTERPHTPIAGLADQLVAAGVRRIEGDVVGDGSYLDGDVLAAGWPPRYLEDLDGTPIDGLTVDEGLELYRNDAGALRSRASVDPVGDAARVLAAALVERGVVITGEARAADVPTPPGSIELGRLQSPPLVTLLTTMVQRSDNHLADVLFRAVGRRVEGAGSFDDGAAQAIAVLDELGLDWSSTTLADGSGLSRDSRVPVALLVTLNYRMTSSSVGATWQDLMAVSGVSGTLQRRLVDTIAELRLRGKTGSLGDVRAISGAVVGPDGRPFWFGVASNELEGPQLSNARRLQDLVVLGLAATLYGCTEIPPPTPSPETTGPPPLPSHTCS